MAKLILVNVDIIAAPTCPNVVSAGYKFFGQPVGANQYSIPKGPVFTFPGGGAQSMPFGAPGKLYLYINNQFISMGNLTISPNPTPAGQLKTYDIYTGYGTFKAKYKVV